MIDWSQPLSIIKTFSLEVISRPSNCSALRTDISTDSAWCGSSHFLKRVAAILQALQFLLWGALMSSLLGGGLSSGRLLSQQHWQGLGGDSLQSWRECQLLLWQEERLSLVSHLYSSRYPRREVQQSLSLSLSLYSCTCWNFMDLVGSWYFYFFFLIQALSCSFLLAAWGYHSATCK